MFSQLLIGKIGKSPFPSISPILLSCFGFGHYGFSIRSWPMFRHTVSKGMRRLTRLTFHSLGWISGRQESGRYRDRVGLWHVMWTLVYVHPIIVTDSHLEYQTFSKWKNTLRTSGECISTINELMWTKLLNVHLLCQIFGAYWEVAFGQEKAFWVSNQPFSNHWNSHVHPFSIIFPYSSVRSQTDELHPVLEDQPSLNHHVCS